jgi:hypothetical protein
MATQIFSFSVYQAFIYDPDDAVLTGPLDPAGPYPGGSVRWEDDGSNPTLEVGEFGNLFVGVKDAGQVVLLGFTPAGDPIFRLTDVTQDTFIAIISDTVYPVEDSVAVVTSGSVTCFLEGTAIATPGGERRVEHLAIGDLVLTADGRAVPVRWMGRQRVRNHALRPWSLPEPVRIAAGALGNGLPHTDLCVSADHGMVWEGVVVNAGALVNGTSIRLVPRAELPAEYTYFHIETEGHEVVLANGAPAETFVDYVTRRRFDNYQEYLALYGAERVIAELPRPRISAQRMLPDGLRAKLGLPPFGAELMRERDALLRRLGADEAKAA